MSNKNLPVQHISAVEEYFESQEDRLSALLPAGTTLDFMRSNVAMAISSNPKLLNCTRASIYRSIAEACELGLMVHSVLGEAWIVPYGNTATLIPGYQGFTKLAYNSGMVKRVESRNVHLHDNFSRRHGTDQFLHLVENDGARGPQVGTYCLVELMTGGIIFEYYTRDDLDEIHEKSKAYQYFMKTGKGKEIWGDAHNKSEMDRKAVWRNLSKWIPRSGRRMALAIDLDNRSYRGKWEIEDDAEERLYAAVGVGATKQIEDVADTSMDELQALIGEVYDLSEADRAFQIASLVTAELDGDQYTLRLIDGLADLSEDERKTMISIMQRASDKLIGKRLRDNDGSPTADGYERLRMFYEFCIEQGYVLTTTRQVDEAKKYFVDWERDTSEPAEDDNLTYDEKYGPEKDDVPF